MYLNMLGYTKNKFVLCILQMNNKRFSLHAALQLLEEDTVSIPDEGIDIAIQHPTNACDDLTD